MYCTDVSISTRICWHRPLFSFIVPLKPIKPPQADKVYVSRARTRSDQQWLLQEFWLSIFSFIKISMGYDLSDCLRETKQLMLIQPLQVLHFTCHSYCFNTYNQFQKMDRIKAVKSNCVPVPLLFHALQSLGCFDVTYLISAVYKWYKYNKNFTQVKEQSRN